MKEKNVDEENISNVCEIDRSKATINELKFIFSIIAIISLFFSFTYFTNKINYFENIFIAKNRFRKTKDMIKESFEF